VTAADRPVVLLTGATGFFGAALAAELLRQGRPVRCTVRGGSRSARTARLHQALRAAGVAEPAAAEAVPGDLDQERLGLTADGFRALGQGVGLVVHCGARVNTTLPYAALQRCNVQATEELLRLAETASARFAFIGSMAAVAPGVAGEPFELLTPVSGGYGQTKWSADQLVSTAHRERRLVASIFRPGRISPDRRTGRSNPDDLLDGMLRVCVRLGLAPVLETTLRISPVDWVAALVAALLDAEEATGRAHHLVTGTALPWAEAVVTLRASGLPLELLPYPGWRAAALDATRGDPALARIIGALPADRPPLTERPTRGPVNARRVLGHLFPELAPPSELLAGTIAQWQRNGTLPAA
jgi:thioester reductase-like protein